MLRFKNADPMLEDFMRSRTNRFRSEQGERIVDECVTKRRRPSEDDARFRRSQFECLSFGLCGTMFHLLRPQSEDMPRGFDGLDPHLLKDGTVGWRGDRSCGRAVRQHPRAGPQRLGQHRGMLREKGSTLVANEESEQEPGSIGVTMLARGHESEQRALMQGDRAIAGRKSAVSASCVRRQEIVDSRQRPQCLFRPSHPACKPRESLQTGIRVRHLRASAKCDHDHLLDRGQVVELVLGESGQAGTHRSASRVVFEPSSGSLAQSNIHVNENH